MKTLMMLLSLNVFASGSDVVPNVDLNRYAGLWYEIAHSPNFFQRNCERSTAQYDVNSPDSVAVLNTCYKKNNKTSTISGIAKVTNLNEPAKLKVRFNLFAKGDYWIVSLDQDYQWAVVSGPDKKSLFILAREAPMTTGLQDEILRDLTTRGYNTTNLVYDRY
jgi:apolipoprotein D and lipocalin family protein